MIEAIRLGAPAARPDLASKGPWLAATAYIVLLGVFVTVRFERGGWRTRRLLDAPPEANATEQP